MFMKAMISGGMAAMTTLIEDVVGAFWIEIAITISFTLGFLLLRPGAGKGGSTRSKGKKGGKMVPEVEFSPQVQQTITTESEAGNPAGVLAAWRGEKAAALTPIDTLKLVVKAFAEVERDAMEKDIVEHLCAFDTASATNHGMVVLDGAARFLLDGTALERFWTSLRREVGVPASALSYALLVGGYAAAGDEKRVAATFAEMQTNRVRRSARAYSLTLKGFLKNGLLDAVRAMLTEMAAGGVEVPTFALVQYCRLGCEATGADAPFRFLTEQQFELPEEAVTFLLDDCAKRSNLELADTIDEYIQAKGWAFSQESREVQLKMYTAAGDLRALKLFELMRDSEMMLSKGLTVDLLSRCAEPKFIRFAEVLLAYCREKGTMTIAAYSALMKVYAVSGKFEKACDLYEPIIAEGLEPDNVMYGCLMRFAVECGRTELSRQLALKTPVMEIQNYMSLIRAAGRDKDAGKALAVLQQLKEATKLDVDIAAYNCALDSVVSAGDMQSAEALMEEARAVRGLDVISYNTLLKGYCMKHDVTRAREVLSRMEADGHPPNDVSYNSVVNAAVSKNNTREAWEIIELMESKGVPVDHFTVAIMMKSLKKRPSDLRALLDLLDRSGLDVTADEVLLNMVLDACIRFREVGRLKDILNQCFRSKLRPAVHTYGALIKGCGFLKWMDKCRELWKEMTEHRAMEPNSVVMGCMLDALVTNQHTTEAVAVFRKWKAVVPPNPIMFSTLMKGFAVSHKAKPAMAMWREMREEKVPMNTVVYNAVIDTQARVGAMDGVTEIVTAMGEDGCRPDAITLSTVCKGYCTQGDLDAAFKVFRDMQRDGMANDSVVYNTLLEGCTKHSRYDLADRLLEDMEQAGVAPSNFTLGTLTKLWGRRNRLDKAFEAVRELPRRWNFSTNAQVYACLQCACLANGAVDRAHEVFEELKSVHGADNKAYGSLIAGCTRAGDLELATFLIEEACGLHPERGPGLPNAHGERLAPEPVEHVLRGLVNKGRHNDAVELLRKARASGGVKISRQVAAIVEP